MEALKRALRAACRSLDDLPGVTLLEDDFHLCPHTGHHLLRCRLRVEVPAPAAVPAVTDWVIRVSQNYPYGEISFWPAKEGGLRETFAHQNENREGPQELPYRLGCLCLTQNYHAVRTRPDDTEPYEESGRLRWHCQRALRWLRAAARDELLQEGDPFELPLFQRHPGWAVIYREGAAERAGWDCAPATGLCTLWASLSSPGQQYLRQLLDRGGRPIREVVWGDWIDNLPSVSRHAGWLRLPVAPVRKPYRMPGSWCELRAVCLEHKVRLDPLLLDVQRWTETLPASIRHDPLAGLLPRLLPALLLIGFPVPTFIGGPPVRMHFEVVQLPPGGRPGKDKPLHWVPCINWHPESIGARGRHSQKVCEQEVLLLGAGSLGSVLAEMLVRAGLQRLVIVDPDTVQPGNLVRHTAILQDLGRPKAEVLRERLVSAMPSATARAVPVGFSSALSDPAALLLAQVVLDTTGDDEVIARMESFPWDDKERTFLSVSLGFGARRLFCFSARGRRFPQAAFRQQLQPWLAGEAAESRQASGCNHPFTPAKVEDVWLMAAAAARYVARTMANPSSEPLLEVYEQPDPADIALVRRA